MPASSQGRTPDIGEFREWGEAAQERALALLEQRKAQPWRPFYCRKPKCDGLPHDSWTWNHARHDQHPPRWYDDWLVWLLSGGRGSGKTRTGSEMTHRAARIYPRLIFIAPTGPDFRETMVEGKSGIRTIANPEWMPEWEPSKKKLTWPNGAVGIGYSAEEPDRLRGPESGFIWADEPAHYPDTQAVWDNMLFGHRVEGVKGAQPKVIATSTPKPTKWMKSLLADPLTITHRVSSYANIANLAESYRRNVLAKYEGTRLGRQELHGEMLEDVEGALWQWDMYVWVAEAPDLKRIVVAVDPAGTANRRSDETGIIIIGIGYDNALYVLDDQSGKYSPSQWADRVVSAYDFWKADAVVVEKTYGRDMVQHTLENSRMAKSVMPRIITVDSRRGKAIRAEPIVAVYEKNHTIGKDGKAVRAPLRIAHVGERGSLAKLEDEQTTWVPGEGDSPNRVDALVHGATELLGKGGGDTEIASLNAAPPVPQIGQTPSLWTPPGSVPAANQYGIFDPRGLS